ncbi:MAG: Secretory lipase [Mycobacterium sp.]|jgi:pimeloyl-ACP methyl ester carboxylesterase|nr:Secretory lipase [Mycobacterium sp.]
MIAAIAVVASACNRSPVPSSAPPSDAGLSLPGDFSGTGPGTLVKAATMPTIDLRLKSATSVAARITYDSTSGVTNSPTEVTGTVFAPSGKPPEGGWPVVAFGHPTTGIQSECAPSLSPNLMNLSSTILVLVKAGYVVAMSDFQGLGDDKTYHPYLDATTAGYNLIDSVRAARKIVPDTSDRWAAFGLSQGGQGTWAANELAGEYGAGLNLVGSVSLSPPLDITGFADAAAAGTLSKEQEPAYQALLASFKAENPGMNLDQYRRGVVADKWDLLLRCDFDTNDQRNDAIDQITPDDLRPDGVEATDWLRERLRAASVPQRPTTAPALVIYGGQDVLIPPVWTDAALQRACEMGDVVQIDLQPDKGHAEIDVNAAFPWVADRFRGDPAPNSCESFVAQDPEPVATGEGA